MSGKVKEIIKNKKIMLSVLAVLIFGGSITGYVVLNQPKQQSKENVVQQEKQDFIVSELLEMKVNDNKTIEVTNGDLSQMTFDVKDKTIASVDEKGVITGIKAGETEITVSLDGQQKVCKVIVGEKQTTATEEKKTTDSKKTTSTTETKKSNGTTSSSNKTETTKPSTGGSTAKPSTGGNETTKPETKPVSYSYIGKKYYNWAVNAGGYVKDGRVIFGDPDKFGGTYAGGTEDGHSGSYWNRPSFIDYSCHIEYVGKGSEDYIVSFKDGFDYDGNSIDVVKLCMENLFENPADAQKHISDYYSWSGWTYNGRNYKLISDRLGLHIHVSAKAN